MPRQYLRILTTDPKKYLFLLVPLWIFFICSFMNFFFFICPFTATLLSRKLWHLTVCGTSIHVQNNSNITRKTQSTHMKNQQLYLYMCSPSSGQSLCHIVSYWHWNSRLLKGKGWSKPNCRPQPWMPNCWEGEGWVISYWDDRAWEPPHTPPYMSMWLQL